MTDTKFTEAATKYMDMIYRVAFTRLADTNAVNHIAHVISGRMRSGRCFDLFRHINNKEISKLQDAENHAG